MRYVFNPDTTFFVVTTSKPTKSDTADEQQVVATLPESVDFPPIYENPDRFFVHFLAKVRLLS